MTVFESTFCHPSSLTCLALDSRRPLMLPLLGSILITCALCYCSCNSLHYLRLPPAYVMSLKPTLISKTASESSESSVQRESLLHKVAVLQAGIETCKHYAQRNTSGKRRAKASRQELTLKQFSHGELAFQTHYLLKMGRHRFIYGPYQECEHPRPVEYILTDEF